MKIAVITCYFDPDYVRARTIRAGLKADKRLKLMVIKNQHTGLLRYPEIVWKLLRLRFKDKPDVWLLTFRGQEILPLVLLLAWGKPVIFDEFIVPLAYATGEQHARSFAVSVKHMLARLSKPFYKWWLRQCHFILADTTAHAELSARLSQVNFRHYRVLPVGTDESVFKPTTLDKTQITVLPFRVFYYGNMLPLHGLPIVLEAIEQLKDREDIEFLIVGGKRSVERKVKAAQAGGAHLTYQAWIPFEQLPKTIYEAAVCLGGPFGNSPQAQRVITGKTYQFLACEAPLIVGASEATSEFFTDKQNALVVSQANAAALAKAIVWAAEHRSELVDIGRAGRRLYDREFSSSVIAAKLAAMVDELPAT